MDIPSQIALNGAQYAVLGLLGRGKGGCTWLAERAGARYWARTPEFDACARERGDL